MYICMAISRLFNSEEIDKDNYHIRFECFEFGPYMGPGDHVWATLGPNPDFEKRMVTAVLINLPIIKEVKK